MFRFDPVCNAPAIVRWGHVGITAQFAIEARAQIRAVLERAHDAMPAWNQEDTFLFAVEPILRLLGYGGNIRRTPKSQGGDNRHGDVRLGNPLADVGVVEIKPAGADFGRCDGGNYHDAGDQLLQYVHRTGYEIGILTNVFEWLLFRRADPDVVRVTGAEMVGQRIRLDDAVLEDDSLLQTFLSAFHKQSASRMCGTVDVWADRVIRVAHRDYVQASTTVLWLDRSPQNMGSSGRDPYAFDPFRPVAGWPR